MASKTLSEQLCKVCGIEPLKDETAYFTGNLGKLPDFVNNNDNFCKLGETKIRDRNFRTIFNFVNYLTDSSWKTKKEFVKNLISILKCDINIYTKDVIIQVKEKIKQTKWEI